MAVPSATEVPAADLPSKLAEIYTKPKTEAPVDGAAIELDAPYRVESAATNLTVAADSTRRAMSVLIKAQ